MADGQALDITSVSRSTRDHRIKKISLAIPTNTKHKANGGLSMNDEQTPVLIIIYLYDEESGKLTMVVNFYYI